jgi:hypothetical protein
LELGAQEIQTHTQTLLFIEDQTLYLLACLVLVVEAVVTITAQAVKTEVLVDLVEVPVIKTQLAQWAQEHQVRVSQVA